MRQLSVTLVLGALCAALGSSALAKGPVPEDVLKGKIIISDKPLPMRWSSVSAYVSQLKALNKSTFWYDKKSGKLKVQYAAFFARPVQDVQVMLVLYDVTDGPKQQKVATENFMNRGDRVLFNAVEFDKEDIDANRKYLMTIENRHVVIAQTNFTLRAEGPHYSGKVEFSDEETKEKR
jgi:hypothetical protein